MRRTQLANILLITTFVPSAPSWAAPQQGTPPAPAASEACSLLKKEDAVAALGEAVTGPKSKGDMPAGPGMTASACEYTGSGSRRVHLSVMHLPADQVAMYKGLCLQNAKEGLAGLGDVACWYNDKHEELQVLKGATLLSIELRGKPNPTEAIKGVAKKVYGRLK